MIAAVAKVAPRHVITNTGITYKTLYNDFIKKFFKNSSTLAHTIIHRKASYLHLDAFWPSLGCYQSCWRSPRLTRQVQKSGWCRRKKKNGQTLRPKVEIDHMTGSRSRAGDFTTFSKWRVRNSSQSVSSSFRFVHLPRIWLPQCSMQRTSSPDSRQITSLLLWLRYVRLKTWSVPPNFVTF